MKCLEKLTKKVSHASSINVNFKNLLKKGVLYSSVLFTLFSYGCGGGGGSSGSSGSGGGQEEKPKKEYSCAGEKDIGVKKDDGSLEVITTCPANQYCASEAYVSDTEQSSEFLMNYFCRESILTIPEREQAVISIVSQEYPEFSTTENEDYCIKNKPTTNLNPNFDNLISYNQESDSPECENLPVSKSVALNQSDSRRCVTINYDGLGDADNTLDARAFICFGDDANSFSEDEKKVIEDYNNNPLNRLNYTEYSTISGKDDFKEWIRSMLNNLREKRPAIQVPSSIEITKVFSNYNEHENITINTYGGNTHNYLAYSEKDKNYSVKLNINNRLRGDDLNNNIFQLSNNNLTTGIWNHVEFSATDSRDLSLPEKEQRKSVLHLERYIYPSSGGGGGGDGGGGCGCGGGGGGAG